MTHFKAYDPFHAFLFHMAVAFSPVVFLLLFQNL